MSHEDLDQLIKQPNIPAWRVGLARWIESWPVQSFVMAVIVLNAAVLGLETDAWTHHHYGPILHAIDQVCLGIFILEIVLKLSVYRGLFWMNGWNWFDFIVVAIALAPNAGTWAVLRSLRVMRVLRLLTVVPQLRRVVAAFLHSIPGLLGVVAVMTIFYYTAGVLATTLFGKSHPQWFGTLGSSLYSLFQIMTLESWSMGIVRPVMEVHPWAWAFFVPFIIIATFTILNLFIGIIVSTMQELALSDPIPVIAPSAESSAHVIDRIERDLQELKRRLASEPHPPQ